MTWIETVPYEAAGGRLRELYERIRRPGGRIDNVMRAQSLRPHALAGHIALHESVLHDRANTLERWLLEALGLWVSLLNGCGYCLEHHFAGLKRLLGDDARAAAMRGALEAGAPERAFSGPQLALFGYAERLTTEPAALTRWHIEALRQAGLDDGQILEANQAVAYFAYANRTVLGLGVTLEGDDPLGLSPLTPADPDHGGQR